MRQIAFDTETTGLEPTQGHRIIEIGAVELVDRRRTGRVFHRYCNPDREVDSGAVQVHGLTNDFLKDQPRFAEIVDELVTFIRDAELIIHNAPFDVGFLDAELKRASRAESVSSMCTVLDTLPLARKRYPGQRNSLDALCKRFEVDNSGRDLHGALLDAQLLLEVYLAMTGGQSTLSLEEGVSSEAGSRRASHWQRPTQSLRVIRAAEEELALHDGMLATIDKASGGKTLWRR